MTSVIRDIRDDPLRTLCILSVALAVIIFAHALIVGRTPAETVADIWELVFLCPVLSAFFWLAGSAASGKPHGPQSRLSEDAARSARRISRVGSRFLVGMSCVGVFIQAVWIAGMFGLPQGLDLDPDVVMRAVFLLIGVLILYLGNIIPKSPPLRGAGADAAAHRLSRRLLGWVLVIHGAAIGAGALLLDADLIGLAWSVAVASALLTGFAAAAGPHFLRHLNSRSAS